MQVKIAQYDNMPMGIAKIESIWDIPGGPGTKTSRSQCRGPGLDPWSGNQVLRALVKDQRPCVPQLR